MLEQLWPLARAGSLTPQHEPIPLSEAPCAAATALAGRHTRGKVLLVMGDYAKSRDCL